MTRSAYTMPSTRRTSPSSTNRVGCGWPSKSASPTARIFMRSWRTPPCSTHRRSRRRLSFHCGLRRSPRSDRGGATLPEQSSSTEDGSSRLSCKGWGSRFRRARRLPAETRRRAETGIAWVVRWSRDRHLRQSGAARSPSELTRPGEPAIAGLVARSARDSREPDPRALEWHQEKVFRAA